MSWIGCKQSEQTLDYTCAYMSVIASVLIATIVVFFFQENTVNHMVLNITYRTVTHSGIKRMGT
jgi:hypothetical protein